MPVELGKNLALVADQYILRLGMALKYTIE